MSTDTVRRDLFIIVGGILAAGWFFFDFGNHHPLSYADASLGEDEVVMTGMQQLGNLGYVASEAEIRSTFRVRNFLLDSLQTHESEIEILDDSEVRGKLQPFYWQMELFLPQSERSSPAYFSGGPDRADFSLNFDQQGRWLEFINPNQRRPSRLAHTEAIRSVVTIPVFFLNVMRTDSVVLDRFTFDFTSTAPENATVLEEGRISFTRRGADQLARYYLEQTGWPEEIGEPETARIVSFDNFEAAELVYRLSPNIAGFSPALNVNLSPGGALLSLEVTGLPFPGASPSAFAFILNSIRGFLLVVIFLWLVILLYIRIQGRVVDIKAALLIAVLAGLLFPSFELLRWLYTTFNSPGSPEIFSVFILLIQLGVIAAFASIGYFMVTVTGESITRQNWPEKIATFDLIRAGHLYNRPVGLALLHAVCFSFILAAGLTLLYRLFPGAYMSVPDLFETDSVYLASFVELTTLLLTSFILVQLVFLVFMGHLKKVISSDFLLVTVTALLFSLLISFQSDVGPPVFELLFSVLISLLVGVIYLYRDFLTAFLSFFLYSVLIATADAWVMESSPDVTIFYPAAGLVLGFLLFGFIAVTRGRPARDLPAYVPDYIEALAQDERIRQELQIARKVQQSFLPARKPEVMDLDIGAVCIPAYETGGDYYDFIKIDESRMAVTIGDVSGKGFQAAFYMTFIKGVLHALCRDYSSSVDILNKANELFYDNARRGTFISLIFGVIDLPGRKFHFSRAGHNPLLHYRHSLGRFDIIKPNGLAIGMTNGEQFSRNISEQSLELEDGDLLILFTDGIVEAVNVKNDYYGQSRLQELVELHRKKTSEEIVKLVVKDINRFSNGASQHDDMTLLIIQRK